MTAESFLDTLSGRDSAEDSCAHAVGVDAEGDRSTTSGAVSSVLRRVQVPVDPRVDVTAFEVDSDPGPGRACLPGLPDGFVPLSLGEDVQVFVRVVRHTADIGLEGLAIDD